ncbi:type IV pilin [Oxyplasma meridianum]|uniref:Type IV pilin n=1 Tax=Oxyplasma meridianum TaxID=3073602 RepID=A0AAX4NFR8_9ARCH
MKGVVLRKDSAVSPIIGTILLVAITVTLVASLYTLLNGYVPTTAYSTPQASFDISNNTVIDGNGGYVNGTYAIYVQSINTNIPVNSVTLVVTNSIGNITTVSVTANDMPVFGKLTTLNVSNPSGDITTDFRFIFSMHLANFYLTRIAFVDSKTQGTIAVISPIGFSAITQ